jgi:hypothetical protein
MKYGKVWLVSALLALSGAAFAQGAGGGNGGGAGGGSTGGGGAGMSTGNDTGAAKAGQGANGGSTGMSHSTKMQHTSKTKKKPMNDTTNTPGADASSDTKGQ